MSVTVQVTVVLPTGKELGASLTTVATPQLSAVTGVPSVMLASARLQAPASLARLSAAGAVIVGFSVSLIVTTKLHSAVSPTPSVTRNVLVVLPTGKNEPLARPAICVVVAPPQISAPTGAV